MVKILGRKKRDANFGTQVSGRKFRDANFGTQITGRKLRTTIFNTLLQMIFQKIVADRSAGIIICFIR